MWKFLWKISLTFVILSKFYTVMLAKKSRDGYSWRKLESRRWIDTFLYELSQPSNPLFYGSYFFSPSRLLYPMNVASEVRNVETSPERNLPCRILCRRDGEYESVIVIRIFWTVLSSRSLFSTTICSHARPFITSGIFLWWLFAAKHANGKSESLKSLFAGRTDVLEWAIATISQVTVSARSSSSCWLLAKRLEIVEKLRIPGQTNGK